MVFSSVPLYLDPPNWNNHQQQQQQQQQQQPQQQQISHGHQFQSGGGGGGGGLDVHLHHHQHQHQQHQQQQQHQLPPVPPSTGALMAPRPDMGGGESAVSGGAGGGAGGGPAGGSSVRPGSMTDRARMAKIAQPEPGLKCPRQGCESTNTKFCYFNNYSLSQPRHFCKTCRRYWTRGGALRNVPVGGGCRRNKRTKSSKSSSSSAASASAAGGTSSSTSSTTTGGNSAAIMPPQGHAHMPFFASLHHVGGGDHYSTGASRLGFPGLSSLDPVDYQLGGGAGAAMGLEQWRLSQIQQFPFFGRTDGMQQQMAGIYPFDTAEAGADASGFAGAGQMQLGGAKQVPGSSGLITQLASVKMEDNPPSNAMASASAREFLGLSGNLQFWGGGNNGAGSHNGGSGGSGADAIDQSGGGGGSWVDLSGFNSPSSGNML